jgi:hypothetical protein
MACVCRGPQVYYAPRLPFTQAVTLPTLFGGFRLLRAVMLRERINLVHGHQAFSTMAHEAIMHARTMGYPAVFTDHSLFGFADASSILVNKVRPAVQRTRVCRPWDTPPSLVLLGCPASAPRTGPSLYRCTAAGAQVHAGRRPPRHLRQPHQQGEHRAARLHTAQARVGHTQRSGGGS